LFIRQVVDLNLPILAVDSQNAHLRNAKGFGETTFTRLASTLPSRQRRLPQGNKITARAAHGHGYLDIDPLFP
jgi:hypothetical protein